MAGEQEKTEKPTGKKIQDARQRGQVARSRDLAIAGASVAATIAMGRMGGRLLTGLATRLAADLAHFGDQPMHAIAEGELAGLVFSGGTLIAYLVGPIALSTMVVGVAVHGLQGGWVFSAEALQLNWSRLNPANGLKRFGVTQSGVDTLKTLLSVAVITWLSWSTVRTVVEQSSTFPWMTPIRAGAIAWTHAESLLWRVAIALGALALGDYGLQRFRLMQSLRMTKQEIKDEHKQQEGNPQVKGKIRSLQRAMARRRMMSDVKRATVVVTNPTHFAVALEYKRGSMAAPVVLAKGADLIALQIRERARQHGVPIVENKPLARALFATTEVGDTIPADLFTAVAEVLAQLIRLKQLTLN